MQSLQPQYNVINIPSVTIIIPAYNEEKRIGRVLKELSEFITTSNPNWNVIVSIDGNDGTEEIVNDYSKKYSFISYSKNGNRTGKGGAIKRVVSEATGEFTVIMDADGSVNFQTIANNLGLVSNYDVILFDRYSKQGNHIPALRRIPSRGFNALVRILLGIRVNDTQCGYKIIRTDMLKRAFSQISITNTFFDVALLFYLKRIGARIIGRFVAEGGISGVYLRGFERKKCGLGHVNISPNFFCDGFSSLGFSLTSSAGSSYSDLTSRT